LPKPATSKKKFMKQELEIFGNKLFVILLALMLCITACSQAGPFPRIFVKVAGLGESGIAQYLKGSWMNTESSISIDVTKLLLTAIQNLGPRAAAESIGLSCKPPPARNCNYSGTVQVESHGPQPENPERNSVRRISISIDLPNYEVPEVVRVTRNDSSIY
jgi:hypothetical protein